ncbi:PIG-L deacetylase family protein [Legionella sp. CNM-4043-24]|uniref:PIG-L deacetylase family protein n=1 Tax=Legionella sp. CNM-4043-24 TaxID=3421646 RepID=UPI00403A9D02
MKNILVVAAHSDDEALGCAGTMARHVAQGDRVSVVFMTNGVGSRESARGDEVDGRSRACLDACDYLGVSKIWQLDFPDNQMDSVPLLEVVKPLAEIIQAAQPQIIYTHFCNDLNVDHRVTHQAVLTCSRPMVGSSIEAVYCFEVLSSTEWNSCSTPKFNPNMIVNISAFIENKMRALSFYHEEMRAHPHSRSYETVKALAQLRGATHGFEYAEAFEIERLLVK